MGMDDEQVWLTGIAKRHNVSTEAVATALAALRRGGGTMAQLSHPDFGGMAQWSRGGMSMVGDMFNSATKAKFDGVMADLSEALRSGRLRGEADDAGSVGSSRPSGVWWPGELGTPSTAGEQNDMRYAFFPNARRLLVEDQGRRTLYDTGSHRISGVAQQQGTTRSLTFSSQHGFVSLADLPIADK